MSLSAAPILLHAFVVLTLLAATVSTTASSSVPVDHRDVNTTMFTNSSATSSPNGGEDFEIYYCFVCTERHPLMIHYCPIYWDECHLNCWDERTSTATAAATAIPDAPVPPSSSLGSSVNPAVEGKECYVMKLYKSGAYVIVERRTCDGIGSCYLSCGGGELADQKVATGGAAITVPATMTMTPAAIQSRFVPFELCNTELVDAAPRRSPSSGAIVVPAGGGAH